MINFDLMQFDQTNLLFLLITAVALIRERRLLPFVIGAFGNLFHGSLGAVFLVCLISWHRMDFKRSRWVQLKDAFGFLLILIGSVATGPFRDTSILFGVLAVSLSFGRGALGIIPALLLLRQYFPHPEPLEVILGAAGFYLVMVEALRWSKSSREYFIRALLEILCVFGILTGLREYALRTLEDPGFIGLGSVFLVFPLILFISVKWKGERFWTFFHRSKKGLASSLGVGNRLISDQNPWRRELLLETPKGVEESFNGVFLLTFSTLILMAVFYFVNRGGFN